MTAQEMIDVLSKLEDKSVELVAMDGVTSYSVDCLGEIEENQPEDEGYLQYMTVGAKFVAVWID